MKIPLFDAHCDTISAMCRSGEGLGRNHLHVDIDRAARYVPYAQFFAIFEELPPGETGGEEKARLAFTGQYERFLREIERSGDRVTFCRSGREAEEAAKAGKAAAFLSVEGAELLGCSVSRLEEAYLMGVRGVVLTWNFENALSGSNLGGAGKGLTPQGVRFVRRCQELGVLVDVSHLSPTGFFDVAELMEKPFIASHSNAGAVWDHPRNLSDRQFRAITERGGVAGINLYADFIGERPGVEDVLAHIEHYLSLGGACHIAMGADLDGCDRLPAGFGGIEDLSRIYEALLKKNYTEALVCDIFYNNLMRVVKDVCDI